MTATDVFARSRTRISAARAVVALMVAATLSACGINSVPTAEEEAKAKWANVQADYQRRADLVPNLVATVRAAAKQETDTLVQVTEARARASSVQLTTDDLNDPAKTAQFRAAQGALSQSLGRLLATVEAYPDLKANANFRELQSQLEGTESRIAISIKDYNNAVRDYNTLIRTFPDMIGAKLVHGAKPMAPFEARQGANQAPDVGAMMNGN